jgi:thiamine transporter
MKFDTRMITFTALMVATALVIEILSTFIFPLPQGGNISLVALPLIILGYYYGLPLAMLAGVLVGVMQGLFVPPFIVSPIQYLLDYVLAFMFMGLGTMFIQKKTSNINLSLTLGIIVSMGLRYVSHVISGTLFFAEYAGDQIPIIYSLIYNLTYMGPTLIVTILAAPIALSIAKKTLKI